jgi:hypothetical protein
VQTKTDADRSLPDRFALAGAAVRRCHHCLRTAQRVAGVGPSDERRAEGRHQPVGDGNLVGILKKHQRYWDGIAVFGDYLQWNVHMAEGARGLIIRSIAAEYSI